MKKSIQILSLISIVFFLSLAASAQTRISFPRGATSTTVTGQLNGYKSARVYIIRVRAGQRLEVEQIRSGSRTVTTTLVDPTGEDVSDMDASCNSNKDLSPTKKGDYRLTVVECWKADAWRGTFRLRIRITG